MRRVLSWLWRWGAPAAVVGGWIWTMVRDEERIAAVKRELIASEERERELMRRVDKLQNDLVAEAPRAILRRDLDAALRREGELQRKLTEVWPEGLSQALREDAELMAQSSAAWMRSAGQEVNEVHLNRLRRLAAELVSYPEWPRMRDVVLSHARRA